MKSIHKRYYLVSIESVMQFYVKKKRFHNQNLSKNHQRILSSVINISKYTKKGPAFSRTYVA